MLQATIPFFAELLDSINHSINIIFTTALFYPKNPLRFPFNSQPATNKKEDTLPEIPENQRLRQRKPA